MRTVRAAKRLRNATRGGAQGARRDGGQTRFVERSLIIADGIDESRYGCTRLSVVGK